MSKPHLRGLKKEDVSQVFWDVFWEYLVVGEDDECWEYSGKKSKSGYGRVSRERKTLYTHRMAYAFYRGPVPPGLLVCHECDNPPCCNPNHLFLGTHLDNRLDCCRKGRQARIRGEARHNSPITDADVVEIRRRFRRGMAYRMAEEYGVHPQTIYNIVNRVTRTLPGEEPKPIGQPLGEDRPNAKLTEALVREIRARHTRGELAGDIAADVGQEVNTVRSAIARRSWAWVEG